MADIVDRKTRSRMMAGIRGADTRPEIAVRSFLHRRGFRFRLRAPHWSCARGWMIGAAGPFRDDGAAAVGVEPFASSVYSAEDDDELDGHLDAILEELGAWSDTDDD